MPLSKLYRQIGDFYAGTELVFGDGDGNTSLLLIGEAPGKDEVAQKKPFVGKAGKNLDEFLKTLRLKREEIYITNVCKFRPFKVSAKGTISNRPPSRREVMDAQAFLHQEIGIIAPEVIVTLGNTPLRAVTDDFSATIGEYHGKPSQIQVKGKKYWLFALYHPASVIYNQSLKEVYEADLKALCIWKESMSKK